MTSNTKFYVLIDKVKICTRKETCVQCTAQRTTLCTTLDFFQGTEASCICVCTKRVCVRNNEPKEHCTCIQYIRISVFVQSRRVHLFIVNCLLKTKFNIHVIYYLYILVNTVSQIFMQKIILIEFKINYSLFKLNYYIIIKIYSHTKI